MTALGALVAAASALGTLAGIVLYGELTALFVQRTSASLAPRVYILNWFGGGEIL